MSFTLLFADQGLTSALSRKCDWSPATASLDAYCCYTGRPFGSLWVFSALQPRSPLPTNNNRRFQSTTSDATRKRRRWTILRNPPRLCESPLMQQNMMPCACEKALCGRDRHRTSLQQWNEKKIEKFAAGWRVALIQYQPGARESVLLTTNSQRRQSNMSISDESYFNEGHKDSKYSIPNESTRNL